MVYNWGNPPDTNQVLKEINNLHMWCGIFRKEQDAAGATYPGEEYWSNLPSKILPKEFYTWTISSDYENMYDIEIPLEVSFGDINNMPGNII